MVSSVKRVLASRRMAYRVVERQRVVCHDLRGAGAGDRSPRCPRPRHRHVADQYAAHGLAPTTVTPGPECSPRSQPDRHLGDRSRQGPRQHANAAARRISITRCRRACPKSAATGAERVHQRHRGEPVPARHPNIAGSWRRRRSVRRRMAVYQNGVRVNEVFGDTVNWDFIPEYAVARLDVVPGNPVYGLNALGGALSIRMKDGFGYPRLRGRVLGGFFGRRAVTVQAGKQVGNVAGYIAADALNDKGWRDRRNPGCGGSTPISATRGENSEFHISYTGASNFFGAAAATPVEMLNRRWSQHLHDAADLQQPAQLRERDRRLRHQRPAQRQGRALLSRLPAEAHRRQHQRGR